jgi:hypothetical protein
MKLLYYYKILTLLFLCASTCYKYDYKVTQLVLDKHAQLVAKKLYQAKKESSNSTLVSLNCMCYEKLSQLTETMGGDYSANSHACLSMSGSPVVTPFTSSQLTTQSNMYLRIHHRQCLAGGGYIQ